MFKIAEIAGPKVFRLREIDFFLSHAASRLEPINYNIADILT